MAQGGDDYEDSTEEGGADSMTGTERLEQARKEALMEKVTGVVIGVFFGLIVGLGIILA